ncbi:TrkH family potassium uptake protein [Roseiconus nitratireducens]|nr:potassium transporter TrkG [Roseiconus nitratireducens]
MRSRIQSLHPLKLLLVGYAFYITVGWIVLSLPVCHQNERISALDNLFTATSAVSTTGLATVGTPDSYSFWGEATILVMIQLGGIGYMTLGSFILLARKRELPSTNKEIAKLTFAMPEGFSVRGLLLNVVLFTAVIEICGAVCLFFAFRAASIEDPLWQAIFHAVSAFCTAGFSLFPNGLEQFASNFWVNAIIAILSLSGAIGFLVFSDFFWSFTGFRQRRTLTTKIILHATFWTLVVAWALLFLMEPSYRELPSEERLLVSGFQAMTALTTVGFNTTPIGEFSAAPTFLLLAIMIIGASPSGTGGGLKSTSVSAAFATVYSTLRGRDKITFWGVEVPQHRLLLAFASIVFYVVIFFVGATILLLLQSGSMFEDVVLEAASALGTVGLSRGLTGDLEPLSKVVVIALMFIGRVGPITFGLALFASEPDKRRRDDLAV